MFCGKSFVKLQNCSHNFLLHFPNIFYIMLVSIFMPVTGRVVTWIRYFRYWKILGITYC